MKYFYLKLVLVAALPLFLASSSCKENNNYHGIPDVYVNFTINLSLPLYSDLNNIGGFYLFREEGYKGVLIYHNLDDTYLALEACCTYHPLSDCATIVVDQSGIFLRCGHYEGSDFIECCASHYDMQGFVIQNPAIYTLKRYNVFKDGETLYVSN